MEDNKSIDLRTRRTKKKINENFRLQVIEHGYDKVSIVSIMEDCGLSRATFYKHYNDLNDLYNLNLLKIINKFMFLLDKNFIYPEVYGLTQEHKESMIRKMTTVLSELQEDPQFIIGMISADNHQLLANNLYNVLTDEHHKKVREIIRFDEELKVPFNVVLQYGIQLIASTIYWWLTRSSDTKPEIIAETLIEVLSHLPFRVNN